MFENYWFWVNIIIFNDLKVKYKNTILSHIVNSCAIMLHMKSIGIIIYYAKVNLFENKNFDNCSTEIIFASRYCIIRVTIW